MKMGTTPNPNRKARAAARRESSRHLALLTGTALGLGLATSALASDGVLEINEACVPAGCFPGDSAGFPVEIDRAGSYRLTSNLEVPDADTSAISLSGDAVSVDLGGFALIGPVSCTDEPVTSCSPSGAGTGLSTSGRARVSNGAIQGFGGDGISTAADSVLWDLVLAHNGGRGASLSRGSSIRDSTIVFNGGDGVNSTAGGGFASVVNCTVRGNNGHGVNLSSGLVLQSRLHNNGAEGFQSATGGGTAGYAHNIIDGNGSLAGTGEVNGGAAIDCNVIGSSAVCPP